MAERRIQIGDHQALQDVYLRHRPGLRAWARRNLIPEDQIDEVLHDVIGRIIQIGRGFDCELHLIRYMRRSIRNRAISDRRLGRIGEINGSALPDGFGLQDRAAPSPAPTPDPDAFRILRAELWTMPPIYQTQIDLYARGLTFRQIAEAMGEPIGTVKSRMHRIFERLRARLNGGLNDAGEQTTDLAA